METIKCNKSAIGDLIHWSSSRFNERKKSEIITDIIFRVERGTDCKVEYRSGVYSEAAHTGRIKSKWTGSVYTLQIENGRAFLYNTLSDVSKTNIEKVELLKPVKNTYFVPAQAVIYRDKEYRVVDQNLSSFIIEGSVERTFQNRFRQMNTFESNHLPKNECKVVEKMEKQRLFVDMDGTLAEFKHVGTLETLYEQGYFLSLQPNENVVEAVRNIIHNHPEIEVNILSAVLSDSPYALNEKNAWLDKYLPEIDRDRRLFPFCGMDKKEFLLGGIRENDFLLDDYTHNLTLWCPPGRGIKILNGINHTRGTWEGDKIRFDKNYKELSDNILHVMKGLTSIHDNRPGLLFDTQTYNDLDDTLVSMKKELKSMKDFETKYFHIGDNMNFKVFCYPDIDMLGHDIFKYDVVNLSSQEVFSKLEDFQVYSFFQDFITERFFLIVEKDSLEPDFSYELEAQVKERAALLEIIPTIYAIYQLKSGEENRNIRWLGYEDLTKQGNYPDINNYKLVYKGILEDGMTLEDIYQKFNLNQPEHFLGHSLSKSDIVVLEKSGSYTAHYCDIFGFFECPGFAKQYEEKLSNNSSEEEWECEI